MTFAIRDRVVLQGFWFIDFVWEIHLASQNAKINFNRKLFSMATNCAQITHTKHKDSPISR